MWGEIVDIRCAGLGMHAGRDCRFKARRLGRHAGWGEIADLRGAGWACRRGEIADLRCASLGRHAGSERLQI